MMIFNRPSTILVSIIIFGTTACVASPAPTANPEDVTLAKRVWLSNINVQAACTEQYGNGQTAVAWSQDCNGWLCRTIDLTYRSVDMNLYCRNQHGTGAYASCGGGTLYDWQCHRN